MDKLTHPHDKYFRASMANACVAEDFLKAHLPSKVSRLIDWHSLKQEPNQLINSSLSESMTDILYSAKLHPHRPDGTLLDTGEQTKSYLSVLVEHQSTVDPFMALRLLRYCLDIMNQSRQQYPERKQLPWVVPILFYTGQAPYNAPTDFFELCGQEAFLVRETLMNPFNLIDLHRIADPVLQAHYWAGVMEITEKHIRDADFIPTLETLTARLRTLFHRSEGKEYVHQTIHYAHRTASLADQAAFARIVTDQVSTELGATVMSLSEQCHQQGLQRGRQEALSLSKQCHQEGLQQGRQEGLRLSKQRHQEGLQEGRQEGLRLSKQRHQEGLEEGERITKVAIARRMLGQNVELSIIADATGLTVKELQALQKSTQSKALETEEAETEIL